MGRYPPSYCPESTSGHGQKIAVALDRITRYSDWLIHRNNLREIASPLARFHNLERGRIG